jgi:hypothetical protein
MQTYFSFHIQIRDLEATISSFQLVTEKGNETEGNESVSLIMMTCNNIFNEESVEGDNASSTMQDENTKGKRKYARKKKTAEEIRVAQETFNRHVLYHLHPDGSVSLSNIYILKILLKRMLYSFTR